MAGEISAFTGLIKTWILDPMLWLVLLIIVVGGLFLILLMRKKKKFIYAVVEIVDLGEGKQAINTDLKAGWFGKKLYLKGLFWSGEEVLRTNHMDRIEYFSTTDFTEINGKRGIVCYRDPIRQGILVPISRVTFKNKELVAAIAPADYTDVAVDIVKDATAETSTWKDKLIQFGSIALIVIFCLIAIIVITQMVKQGQDKAAELLMNAGKEGAAACKDICASAINIAKGGVK